MAWDINRRSGVSNLDRLNQILETGVMQRSDYTYFANILLSGQRISDGEREKISRVFDFLRLGRVQLRD
jgi:hypothetical protein